MSVPNTALNLQTYTGHKLTPQEALFISAYMACGNAAQAVREAGYQTKRPDNYGGALLRRAWIQEEIQHRIAEREEALVAKPAEILRFYTSVMRGEVLDQFGIEASIDTRIKAANELAKHQIEIPLRLEQKNLSNNVGSITLNFLPRPDSD